ncbi:MAG: ATP-binding cassette domain-containing protein [Flammeovirgaceae bacterium]|nr:ATP-binding cassette domain-containing protein [Flammeovirgaceae bacterium]
MISTSGLTYAYNEKILAFPDLKIESGNHLLLLGESGSGKTTLLHLLGGLLRSQKGSIKVANTDVQNLTQSELDSFRGRHIGFIFQKNHLISALTVFQNLMLAPFLSHQPQNPNWIEQLLEKLSIAEKRNSQIKELSHGQAQRVAIARALMNKPQILLADEPTSALDDTNCNRVIDLLLEVASWNQSSLVIATHDQRLKNRFQNQILL